MKRVSKCQVLSLVEFCLSCRTMFSGGTIHNPCQRPAPRILASEAKISSKLLIDLEKKAAESCLCAERDCV